MPVVHLIYNTECPDFFFFFFFNKKLIYNSYVSVKWRMRMKILFPDGEINNAYNIDFVFVHILEILLF